MRYSKQREEILKVVQESCDHPDANTIYIRIKDVIPNVSLGTVYRNLDTLSKNGIIKRIPMKDGNDRFDKTITNHNHMYCEKCGKVIDIDLSLNSKEILNIERETGFKITNCNFKINGLCEKCRKEEEI